MTSRTPGDAPQLDEVGGLDSELVRRALAELVDVDRGGPQRPPKRCAEGGRLQVGQERLDPTWPERLDRARERPLAAGQAGGRHQQLRPGHRDEVGIGRDDRVREVDEADLAVDRHDGSRIDLDVGDPQLLEAGERPPRAAEDPVMQLRLRERGERAGIAARTSSASSSTVAPAMTTCRVGTPPSAARRATNASCSAVSSRLSRSGRCPGTTGCARAWR